MFIPERLVGSLRVYCNPTAVAHAVVVGVDLRILISILSRAWLAIKSIYLKK